MKEKGYIMQDKYSYDYNYRLDLDADLLCLLQKYINNTKPTNDDFILFNEMKEIVNNPKAINRSIKKQIAISKATKARTLKAKEKIQNAINLLRMENKKVTHYSIAKIAGVSFNTVKKYITLDEIKQS